MDAIYEPSGKATCAAADCPVCRKPHLLDLDQLQVHICFAQGTSSYLSEPTEHCQQLYVAQQKTIVT